MTSPLVLTAGKAWGMRRIADKSGRFTMTAVDQRPPIISLIKERKKTSEASYEDVAEVKAILTRALAPKSSAMLLDPIWAYPCAYLDLDPHKGLLLTLEEHVFRTLKPNGARISAGIAHWTIEKIKRAGADGVKFLAWYRPDAEPAALLYQQDLVQAIGDACKQFDLCFLLELLVYPMAGETMDSLDKNPKRPQMVLDSVLAFNDPKFGVDVFKLESPIAAKYVPDPTSSSQEARECQEWFNKLDKAVTNRPWCMLSAGADPAAFVRVLTFAYRAGASGYLAGRAIWADAFRSLYPDTAAFEAELEKSGAGYQDEINALTEKLAVPWYKKAGTLEIKGAKSAAFCRL